MNGETKQPNDNNGEEFLARMSDQGDLEPDPALVNRLDNDEFRDTIFNELIMRGIDSKGTL